MDARLMGLLVTAGAVLQCPYGTLPGALGVLPVRRVVCGTPAATIMDTLPIVHIPSFGMCTCLGNRAVADATAAALGVLTPMPCIPATSEPWIPGSPSVLIGGLPALQNTSVLPCKWGAFIRIASTVQLTTTLP